MYINAHKTSIHLDKRNLKVLPKKTPKKHGNYIFTHTSFISDDKHRTQIRNCEIKTKSYNLSIDYLSIVLTITQTNLWPSACRAVLSSASFYTYIYNFSHKKV